MDDFEETLAPTPDKLPAEQPVAPSPVVQIDEVAAPEPVLPASNTVQYVQEDGTAIRAIVLRVASDGHLHLFVADENGRSEHGGVVFDANKAPGTWHEA